ncbi:hypothetical protein HO173_004044 [Letharia columbiana]|uniref:Uncharacterized protein n=1 Tax=Letharia columbiana TaxID=112416 RepID=A0A8H6FZT7_9LECA|nr:uncharacterized protein HO173_004044 [Letharia columbiana]KAF6237843.1 hypothetical protein HO173_004044 [Letharia columbiana]
MPGRQSTTAPSLKKPKPKRQKAKRSLNALAIAEQQNPTRSKIRQSRLGKSEPEPTKRKRPEDDEDGQFENGDGKEKRRKTWGKDQYGGEIEHGNDSSGNEWVVGQVNSDDDSDLDSDEALGSSDEERFEGFGFPGSQDETSRRKAHSRRADPEVDNDELRDVDLREDGDEVLGSDQESDGLGEGAVDLDTMLDASDDDYDDNYLHQSPGQSSQSLHGSESDGNPDNGSSTEDGESVLSYSGDEDDAQESAKLASLQTMVSTMNEQNLNTGRSRAPVDAQESTTPSEFGLKSKRKLTIADMIPSVTDPGLRKSLKLLADNDPKPTSKRGGIPKKLDVPLPKRQQDRLNRAAAYEQSKETLNRWIDTVKHNRRAEHLSFPLKDPNATAPPGSQRLMPVSHSQPLTDLEGTIQHILKDSGLVGPNGRSEEEQMQAFEELETNKMPLEEVQARRAELRRARELLFREEIRAKRIKKIKSKSYRKVHRKERERNLQREKDTLTAAGVDDSESEKERQDRRRAEERMGARHRESRWAKGVKDSGRAKWDEDARGGMTEMARRGEDLRRRIEGRTVAGDDDGMVSSESQSDESEEEEDIEDGDTRNSRKFQDRLRRLDEDGNELDSNDKGSRLASMDFMKKAETLRKTRNDADVEHLRRDFAGEETPSEEEGQEGQGRKSYGPMKSQTSSTKGRQSDRKAEKNEFEERPDSDNEDEEDQDGTKDEDVDIVVDNSSVQVKANAVVKPSLGDKPRRKPYENQEVPIQEASENPWLMGTKKDSSVSRRRTQNPNAGAIISNNQAVNAIPPPAEKIRPRSALKGARQAEASRQSVQPSKKASTPAIPNTDNPNSENESDDAANLPFVLRNQDLVRKAFAGDEVVANFEQEKRATIQDEDEKVIDSTLPGWGSWTGAGIGKKAERRNKGKVLTKIPGIVAEKRQDAKLDRVIINEKRVKKNSKYLASSLPHPFETRQQYERSLRLPVGPEWTTKETFQGMTKPRILMKPGVIAPMSKPML